MSLERFRQRVETAEQLASLIGTPSELVIRKQLAALDEHMRRFIAESPFALLGTIDREGCCDVSPRGATPSVARVLIDQTGIENETVESSRQQIDESYEKRLY